MGIATIMILCCHASATWTSMPFILKRILGIGNLGVDLFLFLSGVGLSYSFKNVYSINDLFKWYKRRYIRIFIPYTIIMLPILLYYKITEDWSWSKYFIHFSTLDFWLHHKGAWYIAMLIPLYTITPFLLWLFKRLNHKIYIGIVLSFLFYGLSMLQISGDTIFFPIIYNVQGCCLRLPAFFMGIALYPSIKSSKKVNAIFIFGIALMLNIFISYLGNQYYFPFIALIPIFVLTIYLLESNILKASIRKVLAIIGTISLESYLTNVYIAEPCREFFKILPNPLCEISAFIVYIFIVVIGLLTSWYVHCLSDIIVRKIPINKSY